MTEPAGTELLSGVIITHERPRLFARAYRSMAAAVQVFGEGIPVTVYNSSTASVRGAMEMAADGGLAGREIHVPNKPGVAAKRALAVEQCASEWLVTLDDDCEMVPDALRHIAERIRTDDNPVASVGAYFVITGFAGDKDFWFQTMEGADLFTDFNWAGHREELPWGPTSMAVLNVRAVREVGGFDPSIGLPIGGEDVDICLRLRRHGYRLLGIPRVLAVHTTETWRGMRKNLRRNLLYGAGELALMERWPEYRTLDRESLAAMGGTCLFLGILVAGAGGGAMPVAAGLLLFPLALVGAEAVVQGVELHKPPIRALALAVLHLIFKLGYQLHGLRRGRWDLLLHRMDIGKVTGDAPPGTRELWKPLVRWSAVALPFILTWL